MLERLKRFFAALNRIAFRKVESLSFLDEKPSRENKEKTVLPAKPVEKPFYGTTDVGPYF